MTTVAETIVTALGDLGVRTIWGVVGDALNPVTEAIRQDDRLRWIGTRHEEAAAFAASAQAQLTGTLGVCMGTVGPGSIHLLNGLYDAAKSHAPVLAICGQVPLAEMGGDYFQEVDNDLLFADVAAFRHTITAAEQLPRILQQAVNAAYARPGVAVLTLPGDVGSLALPKNTPSPRFVTTRPTLTPDAASITAAAELINDAAKVTLLVGIGARHARDQVLEFAEHLQAPMVLTIKAKEGLERENPYQIGQSGLIGNPASKQAFDDADLLLMLGTDFPYPDWLPAGTPTIQVDTAPANIGRRTPVDVGVVGDVAATVTALRGLIKPKTDDAHLSSARSAYRSWHDKQQSLADPSYESSLVGKARAALDNRHHLIRPEAVAATLDRLAADDAIFTTDTG
ncbi:MAG TPA: thiamine pyrophosphate-binding protein, partial [Sporichthyaceae bacterium]